MMICGMQPLKGSVSAALAPRVRRAAVVSGEGRGAADALPSIRDKPTHHLFWLALSVAQRDNIVDIDEPQGDCQRQLSELWKAPLNMREVLLLA